MNSKMVITSVKDIHPPPLARAALGATPPWKTVTVDGINLTYNDTQVGDLGPDHFTLVCLHALAHGARDFQHLLQSKLGKNHRLIALDFPSHGHSDADHQPTSVQRYAQILALFLDQLQVSQVILLGNSMGGSAALHYAANHPDRVQGLILENPGGLDPMDALKRFVTRWMAWLFAQGNPDSWLYKKGFGDYYRFLILPNQRARDYRKKIVAAVGEMAPVMAEAWRSFSEITSDLREMATTVPCPILFAWATQDKIVQLRRCLPTIQTLSKVTLRQFKAGHAPHLETPEEFEQAVELFLQDLLNHAP